jgi:hypothetical protein
MLTPSLFLCCIGLLGALDITWFHTLKGQLTRRPECRAEAVVHVVRGFVYGAQFLVVPFVRLRGAWYVLLVALFVVDAAVAITDVLLEPASRAPQGGLAPVEYLMHIVLSVLVGGLLHSVFSSTWGDWQGPTQAAFESSLPRWLQGFMRCLAAGSMGVAALEGLSLWESTRPTPAPIHVRVRLRTTIAALWAFTQDHRLHPSWDHRFSRIELLADEVRTGTTMRYEKDLGPLTIRGFGRYKLHKPLQQSTFEFWSHDVRSLIERGVGLWRYTEVAPGVVEFATSYTYTVRWGLLGRVIDRLVFRPVFQWFTEQSFARLAREHFPSGASAVLGAHGRLPARFSQTPTGAGATPA